MTLLLLIATGAFFLWTAFQTVKALAGRLPQGETVEGPLLSEISRLRRSAEAIRKEAARLDRDGHLLPEEERVAAQAALAGRVAWLQEKLDAMRAGVHHGQAIERDLESMRGQHTGAGHPGQGTKTGLVGLLLLSAWLGGGPATARAGEQGEPGAAGCPEPEEISAQRLVTILDLYESYLVVEQSWWFGRQGGCGTDLPESGREELVLVLPEGAQGIHLLLPDESQALAGDGRVLYYGPIGPSGDPDERMPSVVYRFSLANRSREHAYRQPMPMAVSEAVVVVPQMAEHTRFERLDVELWVPQCGRGGDGAEVVCFPSPTGTAAAGEPLAWMERRAARSGAGLAGSLLTFETRGWPVPPRAGHWVALAGSLLLMVGGAWLVAGSRWERRRQAAPFLDSPPSLEQRRKELLSRLLALQRVESRGEPAILLLRLERLAIIGQLDVIYSHIEAGSGSGDAPTAPQPRGVAGS
ncbi:MAG: hypothetical protein JW797_10835 [Bradymonadales bacterium]|nr:hypothetical protein [Bradymonadales bacterium]